MATVITTKKGNKITLRNPAEKGQRYAEQLKSGKVKETKKKLNKEEKAYRKGYLNARSDNSRAWCKKNGVGSKAKKRKWFKKKK